MNKPLIDLYKYYPEEFKSLTHEQLIIVHEYCNKQEVSFIKQIEELEEKQKKEKKKDFYSCAFGASVVGFFATTLEGWPEAWHEIVAILITGAILSTIIFGLANSAYSTFAYKIGDKKIVKVIKTILGFAIALYFVRMAYNFMH